MKAQLKSVDVSFITPETCRAIMDASVRQVWIRSQLEEIKYKKKSFLRSGVVAKRSVEFRHLTMQCNASIFRPEVCSGVS